MTHNVDFPLLQIVMFLYNIRSQMFLYNIQIRIAPLALPVLSIHVLFIIADPSSFPVPDTYVFLAFGVQ